MATGTGSTVAPSGLSEDKDDDDDPMHPKVTMLNYVTERFCFNLNSEEPPFFDCPHQESSKRPLTDLLDIWSNNLCFAYPMLYWIAIDVMSIAASTSCIER